MPNYVDPQRGPLSNIDPAAAKEIGSLWSTIEGRLNFSGSGDHVLVRRSDMAALEQRLSARIAGLPKAEKQGVLTGGSGSSTTIINQTGGPSDITPPVQIASLKSGAITGGTGPSILLEAGAYSGVIEIQRTTNYALEALAGGGQAGMYVQHRISGHATINSVNSGIRVQTESSQTSSAVVNDLVGGYFGINSKGVSIGAFGIHVDAYHASTGNTVMYGSSVEMFRSSLDGKTIGFHARSIFQSGNTYHDNDYAFLASPQYQGAPTKWKTVFAAGSNYIGVLRCNVGLDLSYAVASDAAIMVAANQYVMLNGPSTLVGLFFDPSGKTRFFSDIGYTFSVGNNGCLFVEQVTSGNDALRVPNGKGVVWSGGARIVANNTVVGMGFGDTNNFGPGSASIEVESSGLFSVNNPETVAAAGAVIGYWKVKLGGLNRMIEFRAV